MEVTEELSKRARQFGACRTVPVGTPVGQIDVCDLIWVEDVKLLTKKERSGLPAPLWAMAKDGYGYGAGYGDGYGYGYGDGYGYGYGYGDGYGDGQEGLI